MSSLKVLESFSLSGKTALVHNAYETYGREAAEGLLAAGANVFLSGADAERINALAEDISKETGYEPAGVLICQQGTIKAAKGLVADLRAHTPALDILVYAEPELPLTGWSGHSFEKLFNILKEVQVGLMLTVQQVGMFMAGLTDQVDSDDPEQYEAVLAQAVNMIPADGAVPFGKFDGGAVIFLTDYKSLIAPDPYNYISVEEESGDPETAVPLPKPCADETAASLTDLRPGETMAAPDMWRSDFNLLEGYVKGGFVNYTRQIAGFLGHWNIRANTLAFAPFAGETDEFFAAKYKRHTHLKRLTTAEDVRSTVVFLASEASSLMTGLTVPVDGGYTVK